LGEGTTLQATFQHSHIDRAPLGDVTGTLLAVILASPRTPAGGGPAAGAAAPCDVVYIHRVIGSSRELEFVFDTASVRARLGDLALAHPEVRRWIEATIARGEAGLEAV
jgi:hypothetical protein